MLGEASLSIITCGLESILAQGILYAEHQVIKHCQVFEISCKLRYIESGLLSYFVF